MGIEERTVLLHKEKIDKKIVKLDVGSSKNFTTNTVKCVKLLRCTENPVRNYTGCSRPLGSERLTNSRCVSDTRSEGRSRFDRKKVKDDRTRRTVFGKNVQRRIFHEGKG